MKRNRHSVLRIPRPPGFRPSSPVEVPPEFVAVPRVDLGRAAAIALELNAAEIAKGAEAQFFYVPVKAFEPAKRRRLPSPQPDPKGFSVP